MKIRTARLSLIVTVTGILSALLAMPAYAGGSNNQPAPGAQVPATTPGGQPRDNYVYAVTKFDTADGLDYNGWSGQAKLGDAVCDMLTTEMVKSGRDMVERKKLKEVIGEQDLGASGRVDSSTAPAVGKLVGADYMIVGTITEWGEKETGAGAAGHVLGGLFGGSGNSVQYHEVQAEVKIDYRVVNARTGRIVSGSANTAGGTETTRGVGLTTHWYNSVDFSQSEWTQTQIGKATRRAVQQIATQLASWSPNDGGAQADRAPINGKVLAIISPEEFVFDQGRTQGVQVGDPVNVIGLTPVKNSSGEVVYSSETPIGHGTVVDVQEKASRVKFTEHAADAPKLKEGDKVGSPTK